MYKALAIRNIHKTNTVLVFKEEESQAFHNSYGSNETDFLACWNKIPQTEWCKQQNCICPAVLELQV